MGAAAALAMAVSLVGEATAEEQVYGDGLTGTETMLVSELLENPGEYVGKVVRVEGLAVDVCAHRGCWVNISSDVEGDVVRLKVTDGVIVFPPEILGDMIVAEGVWTANELDLETTKAVCSREAQAKGEDFDPESVTSCRTLYQITGTGAVVREVVAVPESEAPAEDVEELESEKSDT
jgi:hypothetical protein